MTIYQQPDSLSLSGNIKDIILTDATDKVVFRLSVGSTLILEHIYYPDEEHRIVIDIRRFVEEQLSFSLTYSTNPWEQPLLARSFSFTAGNLAAQTFTAIRTGIDHPGETAANWLRSNFLTWQPTVKHVTYSTPELLTYYAASACKVQIKVYYPNGTSDMLTAITLTAGVWTIPVSYAVIASRLGLTGQEALQQAEQLPGAYDVWIEDTSGNRLTYVQRYVAGNTRENEQWILFENSLGGVDCFRAYGQGSLETEHEHQLTDVDDETDEYRVDTVRRIRKSTGWMNMAERRWMLDFFPSRHRWICEDGVFRSIVLTEDSATYTLDNMPAEFEFTFRYTTNLAYLNVPRLLVPPSVLNITAPDLQSFSLPPRLAEFPRLDPSEGALIPVQSPYSDSWSVISAADLISGTSADISRLERMINAEADARRLIQASLDDMFTKDTSTIPARIRANYSLYTNGHLLGMAGVAAGGITDPSSQGGGGGAAYTLSGDIPSANNLKLTLTSDDETLFPSSEVNVSAEGLAEFVKSGTALKLRVTDANVWGAVSGHLLGDGKILPAFLPDYLLGQVMYGGSAGTTGVCTLTQSFKDKYGVTSLTLSAQNASSYEGVYFIASANGTSGVPQTLAVLTGDWIISNGTAWTKIDNTDAVASVNGKTGVVVLDKGDVGLGNVENTKLSTWAGSTNLTVLGTIATGVWHGTSIADAYIASAGTWNATHDWVENNLPPILQSLQSQIDSVASRDSFDNLTATSLFADMLSAGRVEAIGRIHTIADIIGDSGVAAGGITDPTSSGGGGVTDHADLDSLDYANSGHTGFQPTIENLATIIANASAGKTASVSLALHLADTNNPHSVTKTQIGLGNVDNKSSATIRSEITASDIPSLDASKITTGTFADARIASAATWNAKYDKPGTGIPLDDLAADVQTSLGKADSAVQKTDVNLVTGSDSVNDNFSLKLTVKDVTKTLVGIRLTGDTLVPAIIRNVVREAAGDWSCGLGTIQVDGSGKFTIGAIGTYALEAQNGLAYAYLGCNAYNGLNLRITASALTWGTDTIWHAGNSNKITVDWSAKNLTLAGSISGATTIEASGKIHTLSEVVGDSGVAAGGITDPDSSGGGGGGSVDAVKVNGVTYNPDASGVVELPNYYTKTESDTKYATKTALQTTNIAVGALDTRLTADEANISGMSSDIYTLKGYFTTGKANDSLKLGGVTAATIESCIKSLQSQIDSVSSRDSFDELTATALFADTITAREIVGYATQAWVSSNYSPIGHTHSYLPLSGGQVTGGLWASGGLTVSTSCSLLCNLTPSGTIDIGDSSNTFRYGYIDQLISNEIRCTGTAASIALSFSNSDRSSRWMSITTGGRVGIGRTATGSYLLDVAGSFNADSGYINGNAIWHQGNLDLPTIESCIKSLQSQIDSVSSRDSFDELTATALFADTITAREIVGYATQAWVSSNYSPIGHTHSYLPLSGGQVTGGLWASGGLTVSTSCSLLCNLTPSGTIDIGDSSNTFRYGYIDQLISNEIRCTGTAASIALSFSNSDRSSRWMSITTGGRVGIGRTATGSYLLDVAGSFNADSGYINGNAIWHQGNLDLPTIESCIKSLQSQIDSVSSRDSFDELTATALFADTITAGKIDTRTVRATYVDLCSLDGKLSGELVPSGTGVTLWGFDQNNDRYALFVGDHLFYEGLEVYHEGNIDSVLDNYLPKSGGTLTGNLTLGTHDLIFSGSDQGDIIWYDGSGAEKHRLWGAGADGSLYYRYYGGSSKLIWHQGNLDLPTIESCIKSLQSQIDSVASRDAFDELTASALFADTITAREIVGYATKDWVSSNYYTSLQSNDRFSVVDGLEAPPTSSRQGKPGDFVAVRQGNDFKLYVCLGQVYTTTWLWREVILAQS